MVDTDFHRWIRERGCLLRGCPRAENYADGHHVKTIGAGGRDHRNLVPLCHPHHEELHRLGTKTFERTYVVNLDVAAVALWELYQARRDGGGDAAGETGAGGEG